MEMTDEEFFQKVYLVALAGPPTRVVSCGDLRKIASNAVKMFHEEFSGKAPEGAPADWQNIRSKCTKCNAVNEEEIDLTLAPEGTSTRKDCSHCDFTYTYEVRIDNS